MKQKVRRALAVSGMAITIGASGLTLTANANMLTGERSHRINNQASVGKNIHPLRTERWGKTVNIRRVIPGIVTAKTDNSFDITHGSKTFTVTVSSDTSLLNQKWATIQFSDIKTGDKIRALGTISGSTITAKTVRDISIR